MAHRDAEDLPDDRSTLPGVEQLTNRFRLGVPVERAYDVLSDVERIAPCLPGAELESVDGDDHRGRMTVRIGPITAEYTGVVRLVHRQPPTKLVLRAEGRETRGQGNANATITLELAADGDGTEISVTTDLTVTGKVASLGPTVLGEVATKLVDQFAADVEAQVPAGEPDGATAEEPEEEPVEEPTVEPVEEPASEPEVPAASTPPDEAPAASPVEAPVVTEEPVEAPVVTEEPVDGEAADPVPAATVRPVVRPEPTTTAVPAGTPAAKRAAPLLAGLATLWLLRVLLRRRTR